MSCANCAPALSSRAHPLREHELVDDLIGSFAVSYPDDRFAPAYARLFAATSRSRQPVEAFDLLIATAALLDNAPSRDQEHETLLARARPTRRSWRLLLYVAHRRGVSACCRCRFARSLAALERVRAIRNVLCRTDHRDLPSRPHRDRHRRGSACPRVAAQLRGAARRVCASWSAHEDARPSFGSAFRAHRSVARRAAAACGDRCATGSDR